MHKKCIHTYAGVSITETHDKIRPCCVFEEHQRKKKSPFANPGLPSIFDVDTLDNLHSLPQYKKIQKRLERGIATPECKRCWVREKAGITSKRIESNKNFDSTVSGFVCDLEIALDMTCNMMCRSCSPEASSKWSTAQTVLKQFSDNNIDQQHLQFDAGIYKKYQDHFYKVLKNTSFKQVKQIKIQGGEPFLAKHFEWLLDKIHSEAEDPTRVRVSIFTNGSVFPDKKILKKIEQFNTDIVFSLDAYGDLATVIRYGVAWPDVEKSVVKWVNWSRNSRVRLMTNTTLSLLNVNQIDPLHRFCRSYGIQMGYNNLFNPTYLSMYQLPQSVRSQWQDPAKSTQFNQLVQADIASTPELAKFIQAMAVLDQYQGVSFQQANPEMHDIVLSIMNQ